MGTYVSGTDLRTLGLDATFQDLYSQQTEEMDQDVLSLYQEVEAKTNQVQFAALYDVPAPVLWTDGDAMPEGSLDSLTHTLTVVKFARKIAWRVDDEEDDQITAIQPRVNELSTEFARLPVVAAVDLLTATASLLGSIPNAYDGSALYISTTRFGQSTGNSITGAGTNTPAAIQQDYYSLQAQVKGMRRRTSTGEPFWNTDKVDDLTQYLLIFSANATVTQNARAAFGQQITLDVTGTAGVTNVLASNQPRLKFWTRLSGSDWYGFFTGSQSRKPFVMAKRHPSPVMKTFNDETSDRAKDFDEKAVGWKQRLAFGYFAPETTVRVDN